MDCSLDLGVSSASTSQYVSFAQITVSCFVFLHSKLYTLYTIIGCTYKNSANLFKHLWHNQCRSLECCYLIRHEWYCRHIIYQDLYSNIYNTSGLQYSFKEVIKQFNTLKLQHTYTPQSLYWPSFPELLLVDRTISIIFWYEVRPSKQKPTPNSAMSDTMTTQLDFLRNIKLIILPSTPNACTVWCF